MKAVCALFLTVAFSLTPLKGASEDELAIRKVLADSTGAFNRHAANLTPEGYADDFDAVNPAGARTTGKPNLGEAFKTYLKNARKIENVQRIRFIRPEVALVDAEVEFTGTDITPYPRVLETIVLVKKDGHWVLTALRMMVPPARGPAQ